MANVRIVEKKTGRVCASVAVNVGGQNYVPSEKEYIDEAWRCAVDDGDLPATANRADYEFQIAR